MSSNSYSVASFRPNCFTCSRPNLFQNGANDLSKMVNDVVEKLQILCSSDHPVLFTNFTTDQLMVTTFIKELQIVFQTFNVNNSMWRSLNVKFTLKIDVSIVTVAGDGIGSLKYHL